RRASVRPNRRGRRRLAVRRKERLMKRAAIIVTVGAVVAVGAAGAFAAKQAAPPGPSYKLVGTWGKTGTANGQFASNVHGIAVDKDGNVFAAVESSRGAMRKYAKTASGWEASGGPFGAGDYRVDDVEVAPDGTIYATTSRTQPPFEDRIRRYSADGQALGS